MIDIHCHILPGVDDGSTNVEESAKLLEMLKRQGVRAMAATPHFYAVEDTPEAFLQRRSNAFAQLRQAGIPTDHILPGAEVAYFDEISHCDALTQLQLGNSRLLLVEMPFHDWNDRMVQQLCNIPAQLGLQPVLAHIERYPGRKQLSKYLDLLLEQGMYLQCNATAFLKGWKSRRYFRMLQKGQIHFLGSDCHNLTTRPPKMDLAAAAIEKRVGAGMIRELDALATELLFNEKD